MSCHTELISARIQLHCFLVLTFCILTSQLSTFIWDPNSPGSVETWRRPYSAFSNPPICLDIPANLTLCYGIKYPQMRLPNLFHHDSLNEVIQQSESWIQLTKIKCHPDTQLFLCSLFSPVCLDQTIPPCRSLCESVRSGCEPFMLKHGYSWPSIIGCDQFPVDNNMCIQSQSMMSSNSISNSFQNRRPGSISSFDSLLPFGTKSNNKTAIHTASQPESAGQRPNRNKTVSKEDEQFYKNLIDTVCKSDWIIKSGINIIRKNQVRIKKYKVIFGSLTQEPPFALPVNKSSIVTSDSSNGKRKQKYLIIGTGDGKQNQLSSLLVVSWLKNTPLIKKAIKNVKLGNACKKSAGIRADQTSAQTGPKRRKHHNRSQHSNRDRSNRPNFN